MPSGGGREGLKDGNIVTEDSNKDEPDTGNDEKPLTFLEVLGSTLAAAIGVQSKKNKERDFTRGNVMQFIAAGVVFTVVFVVGMIIIVNLVLAS